MTAPVLFCGDLCMENGFIFFIQLNEMKSGSHWDANPGAADLSAQRQMCVG
jgi:hypothetical protein